MVRISKCTHMHVIPTANATFSAWGEGREISASVWRFGAPVTTRQQRVRLVVEEGAERFHTHRPKIKCLKAWLRLRFLSDVIRLRYCKFMQPPPRGCGYSYSRDHGFKTQTGVYFRGFRQYPRPAMHKWRTNAFCLWVLCMEFRDDY